MHEDYYEETLDWNLHKLIPSDQRIEKVKACKVTKPRFIGDIGLRAYFQLRRKALSLIRTEKIDFIYIPIPSFYCSLIGRYLLKKTGVKYGIDYIDPWVHEFPGSRKIFSRHWFSRKLATILEPFAVRHASLITGVSEGYYEPVFKRNPILRHHALSVAIPYGGEIDDHSIVEKLSIAPYLFKRESKSIFVYAGALLPKAHAPLEKIFEVISSHINEFSDIEFHFIGTGIMSDGNPQYTVKSIAQRFNLWETVIFEHPQRIPYLEVLTHLSAADAIFIIGSTEAHYTPSKVFQGILSSKPILAVLHSDSSAIDAINISNSGVVLDFDGDNGINQISLNFLSAWKKFTAFRNSFSSSDINLEFLKMYSARSTTEKLVFSLNQIVK